MFNPMDERLNNLHQEESLRKAERERLAQQARRNRSAFSLRLYRPALHRLGNWLVLSGTHLQRRYGELPEMPRTRPARSGSV